MMLIKRSATLALCLIFLTALLASCMPKPVEVAPETDTRWQGKEEIELPSIDSELDTRYENYKNTLPLAFSETEETYDFELEELEDGYAIKKYIGEDNIVKIPSSIEDKPVVAIAANAFADTTVRALYIPDSVTAIEKGSLSSMKTLVTLRIPFIGGEGSEYFGYAFGCSSYDEHAVKVSPTLDVLIVGNGSKIGDNAFAGCKSLSAIVLPESIESIGSFAFYECADLVYVQTGDGVKSIGSYAFGYCSSLRNFDAKNAESLGFGMLYETKGLFSLKIPFVGGSATENRYIGYIFGADIPEYNDEYIPSSLRSVDISGSADIPGRAFASCAYIQNVTLSNEITEIGIRAFYACRSLESISLPENLKTINADAFFACESLKTVEFNGKLEKIGMQAFFACRSLNSVNIPASVKEIGSSAFADCSSLSSVNMSADTTLGKDVFLNCPCDQKGE